MHHGGTSVLVVGAGVFGVTAALELRRRGHAVRLIDPGPLPHPLAASTDISKVVRLDYGPDAAYTALMERALDGWRRWNAEEAPGAPLFHETGVLFLTRAPMVQGGFEHDSVRCLLARGHRLERLDRGEIGRRFPAWSAGPYVDGYYNPQGGWAPSGRVVVGLLARARAAGVELGERQTFAHLLERGSRVGGVATREGGRLEADAVVMALGSWTPHALPWMAPYLRSVGVPVFHLRPPAPELFYPERFPVFCADVAHTGLYGFPLHPDEGVVKVADHGPGRPMAPESPARAVTAQETDAMRARLAADLPGLAAAPIVYTRVCLYCDSWDGHFWIAADPAREGLVVATGGSGHAFKFAPVLGELVADAVEGRAGPFAQKFRWRPEVGPGSAEEAARRKE